MISPFLSFFRIQEPIYKGWRMNGGYKAQVLRLSAILFHAFWLTLASRADLIEGHPKKVFRKRELLEVEGRGFLHCASNVLKWLPKVTV